ncbi:methylmalonyl Co-A mutase-associated GTPase MeaB [Bradyrhizobium genosp. P]|uniref:methylmalonyl Co-A mutase-associated GTPase MeaB n=1 Tax=Bradyrhizobium genosp. P TaxID=83641 RepID=UPI003CF6B0D4
MAKELAQSNLDALIERLVAGDVAALARCITLVDDSELGPAVRQRIRPFAGRANVIGFTGAPGVGKSTLVDAFISQLRRAGRSIAVAAIDPSSPLTGGAVLGDRIRMHRHTADPGVFIRSISSRGHLGGMSESIHWTVDAMDAAGREVVIIETVGTGQSEVEVAEIADVCVVVSAPGFGDDVQAIKAGVLEIADIFVVNKADFPLADLAARQLRSMLALRDPARQHVPIVLTAATLGRGIDELCGAVDQILRKPPAEKDRLRKRRLRRLIAQTAAKLARHLVLERSGDDADALINAVSSGEISLETAATRALRKAI